MHANRGVRAKRTRVLQKAQNYVLQYYMSIRISYIYQIPILKIIQVFVHVYAKYINVRFTIVIVQNAQVSLPNFYIIDTCNFISQALVCLKRIQESCIGLINYLTAARKLKEMEANCIEAKSRKIKELHLAKKKLTCHFETNGSIRVLLRNIELLKIYLLMYA